jgi:hypothetical protein
MLCAVEQVILFNWRGVMQKQLLAVGALLALTMTASAQQVNGSTDASVSNGQAVSTGKSSGTVQSDTSTSAATQTSVTAPKRKDEQNVAKSPGRKSPDANSSSSSSAGLTSGTTINTALAKPVDSKKAKPGDEVVATTSQDVKSNGKVVIPRGSKLIGHVTRAAARGEGDTNSSLAIVFDHAVLKNGQQVPVKSVVQAVAGPANGAASTDDGVGMLASGPAPANTSVRGGGSLLGGVSSTAGAATGAVSNSGVVASGATNSTLGSVGNSGKELHGVLNSSSTGVLGLKGLSLTGGAANSTQGSVISSTGKSVRLDSGTQMVLRVVDK